MGLIFILVFKKNTDCFHCIFSIQIILSIPKKNSLFSLNTKMKIRPELLVGIILILKKTIIYSVFLAFKENIVYFLGILSIQRVLFLTYVKKVLKKTKGLFIYSFQEHILEKLNSRKS